MNSRGERYPSAFDGDRQAIAIEREGDPHPITVVAADLKAIGAPAAVARIDGDASVMSPLDAAGMAIKQQAMDLHHPVNPLVIGRLQASGQRLALEDGVDTSVEP